MKIAIVHHPTIEVETSHIKVPMEQLDNIENATCTEILLRGTLDYVHKRQDLIKTCIKKLRYGGTLIVVGNDSFCIGNMLANGYSFPEEKTISIIYEGRQSISSAFAMTEILEALGLVVGGVNFSDYEYIIDGVREKPNV